MHRRRAPRPWALAGAGLCAALVAVAGPGDSVAGAQQAAQQQPPDLYHWVLPADAPGVEVAILHPNDCYVVREATGAVYFGEPTAALRELHRQVGGTAAHVVAVAGPAPPDEHPECRLRACVDVERLATAMEREMAAANPRATRRVSHDPSPLDNFFGGAYTDVGTDDAGADAAGLAVRARYRNTPEQQMIVRHLATARRDNCYEAKRLRTLTIHVRDHDVERTDRTGVYRGYLYIEHHHPEIAGDRVAN